MKGLFGAINWAVENWSVLTTAGLTVYGIVTRTFISKYLPKKVREALKNPVVLGVVETMIAQRDLSTEQKRRVAAEELSGALERAKIRLPDRQINLLIELAYNRAREQAQKQLAPSNDAL